MVSEVGRAEHNDLSDKSVTSLARLEIPRLKMEGTSNSFEVVTMPTVDSIFAVGRSAKLPFHNAGLRPLPVACVVSCKVRSRGWSTYRTFQE